MKRSFSATDEEKKAEFNSSMYCKTCKEVRTPDHECNQNGHDIVHLDEYYDELKERKKTLEDKHKYVI